MHAVLDHINSAVSLAELWTYENIELLILFIGFFKIYIKRHINSFSFQLCRPVIPIDFLS